MTGHFDLAVLGGGPAGYVAALRAAQLSARTAHLVVPDTLGFRDATLHFRKR